jgi:large subunit ribosomal protein L9
MVVAVGLLCSGVPVVLQVILLNDIEKLGKQGELLTVPIGYWRNFLLPQGQAKVASQDILE